MNKKMILKIAILSCCLVTASQNVALSTIELMTTIPSLFVMLAILLSGFLAKRMNHKTSLLIGLLICGIGGIIPYFIKEVYIMLISRAIFGFGVGMINSNLLIMIVSLFDGKERSQMIGLQGSIGGLGSFLTTYVAGMLLAYGWHVSFLVYVIAFLIFFFVLKYVPNAKDSQNSKEVQQEVIQ